MLSSCVLAVLLLVCSYILLLLVSNFVTFNLAIYKKEPIPRKLSYFHLPMPFLLPVFDHLEPPLPPPLPLPNLLPKEMETPYKQLRTFPI